jgi:hypothetical protein
MDPSDLAPVEHLTYLQNDTQMLVLHWQDRGDPMKTTHSLLRRSLIGCLNTHRMSYCKKLVTLRDRTLADGLLALRVGVGAQRLGR